MTRRALLTGHYGDLDALRDRGCATIGWHRALRRADLAAAGERPAPG